MGLVQGLFGKAKGFLLWLFGWEDPVRTPEQIIDGHIHEMTVTMGRCKVQVAKLIQEQRVLQEKIHKNTNQITHCVREARNAATRNEEEAARDHLRKKHKHEQVGKALQKQLDFFKSQSEQLVDTVRNLELKLDETKRKKMLLMTQRQCAEAQLLLHGAGDGAGGEGVKALLTELEEDVMQKQAKAFLETDLNSTSLPEPTEQELREGSAQQVEDELEQLKKRLVSSKKDDEPGSGPDSTPGGGDGIEFLS
ncbi:MAG: PspA/IM30 family protein [Candidatus Riflebacteria bacterium]|nr:PspA/IM30 family protein [Candidatus Riflebacteria bacterium]